MASGNKPFSFKRLLAELPRGEPLSTSALQARGVSAFRASDLARSGWLTHLGRGVYMLPGDTLTREGCLAYLSQRLSGFHVGGKTALDWRGVRQNVSFREVLTLWGDQPKRLPAWFTQRFDSRYQETQLFDAKLRNGFGLQPLPNGSPGVPVSVPERALLEKTLDELLNHSTRIKVVRLAELLATDLDLPWAALAKRHSQRLGGGKRWIAVAKSGERLDLRRS